MSWETLSYWMLWATGATATLTFVVGLATLYVGHKASQEKDKKVAEAEQRLSEVQDRVSDRSLSDEQRTRLLDYLRASPGKIEVRCQLGQPEICNFAKEIAAVFTEGGWDVSWNDRVMVMPPPVGLKLQIHVDEEVPGQMNVKVSDSIMSLVKGFEAAGLTLEREASANTAEDLPVLLVGYKR